MHLLLSLALAVGGAICPLLGTVLLVAVALLQLAIVVLRASRNQPISVSSQVVATTVFSQAVCLTVVGVAFVLMIPMLFTPLTADVVNRDGLPAEVVTGLITVIVGYSYWFGTRTMQEMLTGTEWQYSNSNSEEPTGSYKLAS